MKVYIRKVLLQFCLFTLIISTGKLSYAQTYIDVIKNAPPTDGFEDVSQKVDAFFGRNPSAKGMKQWQRWKWFAERHLDVDGKVGNFTGKSMEALARLGESNTVFGQAEDAGISSRVNGDWAPIGPFSISNEHNFLGRVNCIAFHPTVATTIFVGTPGGGLWRSLTNGTSWTPLTDGLPSSGISGIAIHPTTPETMYILTGDGNGGNNWGYYVKETGCGVYKSTDGGRTWATTGLSWQQSQVRYGYKLIIHPTNPNILLAATSEGIYRTTNAGVDWTLEIAGEFQDIEFKTNDPTRLCATEYGSAALYVSINTGNTWLAKPLPGGAVTRLEVEVTPARTGVAWVLAGPEYDGSFRGLYIYNWTTEAFTLITTTPNVFTGNVDGNGDGGFPWWAIGLWVSPTDPDNMLLGGVIGRRSIDGGATWFADNGIMHADNHGYRTNPLSNIVYTVNDGGVFRSNDQGDTWTNITGNLQITQYYRMSGTDANANILLAGAQDNGHHLRTTNTTSFNHVITCCDGMDNGINYNNPDVMYGFTQNGGLNKSTDAGANFTGINPTIKNGSEPWVVPFLIHTTTPTTIFYVSKNGVLRHTSSGIPTTGWEDLGGGGGTAAFAMGTSNTNRAYLASTTGLSRTDNLSAAAPSWTIKSGTAGWPSTTGTIITSIDVNPSNSLDVWVTFSGYNANTKVIRSTNGGDSWVNETDNLPNVPVHVVKCVDTNIPASSVYIGTDIGVFYRNGNIGSWILFGNDLPRTMVTDMEVNETAGVITVCTYGRGFWRSPLYATCDANLSITTPMTGSQYHQASTAITVNNQVFGGAGTQVFFKAGNSVVLNVGFNIVAGNEMKASIGPCTNDVPALRQPGIADSSLLKNRMP